MGLGRIGGVGEYDQDMLFKITKELILNKEKCFLSLKQIAYRMALSSCE